MATQKVHYFVNHSTGRKFKVVDLDEEKGVITLLGERGKPFTDDYDKDKYKNLGYKLETVDEEVKEEV